MSKRPPVQSPAVLRTSSARGPRAGGQPPPCPHARGDGARLLRGLRAGRSIRLPRSARRRGSALRPAIRWRSIRGPALAPPSCPSGRASSTRRPCRAAASAAPSGLTAGPTASPSSWAGSSSSSCWRSSRWPRRVRVSATGYDLERLGRERDALLVRKQELLTDLNRLGQEPAVRKLAIDAGLTQLAAPVVVGAALTDRPDT